MEAGVVHDPEHPRRAAIRALSHDLRYQPIEGRDAGSALTASVDPSAPHIPRRQIRPGSQAIIFMLNPHRARRPRRQRGMTAATSLDAGLLIGTHDAVARGKRCPLPAALVQIEHAGGFALEVRVTRKDPAAMRPGTDRILGEPAPQCRLPDGGHEPALDNLAADLRQAPARERHLVLIRQLTGQGLNGDHQTGGKRALGARCGIVPPSRPCALGRNACAIY